MKTEREKKKDELINHLRKWLRNGKTMNYKQWYDKKVIIESEIAELEKQEDSIAKTETDTGRIVDMPDLERSGKSEITEEEVKEEFEKLKQVVSAKYYLSAKEWLQNKYPSMRGWRWNSTTIDDNWVAQQMQEYRQQGMPSKEEISEMASIQVSRYLKARNNPTADLHKRFIGIANWIINKWKGETK